MLQPLKILTLSHPSLSVFSNVFRVFTAPVICAAQFFPPQFPLLMLRNCNNLSLNYARICSFIVYKIVSFPFL